MVYEKDKSVYPVYLHCFGGGLASVTHPDAVHGYSGACNLWQLPNDSALPKDWIPDMFDLCFFKSKRVKVFQTCLEVLFGMSFSNSVIFIIFLIPKNFEKCG